MLTVDQMKIETKAIQMFQCENPFLKNKIKALLYYYLPFYIKK